MWLPTPVYERLPQIWFLLGLLFITGGLYLGLDYPISFLYGALGILCCLSGICVALLRLRHRREHDDQQDFSSATD
jgi:hypothetical protein